MKTAEAFFNWAYDTRANTVLKMLNGEEMPHERLFLSFCSHTPTFVSSGPAGLNAAVKGVGFLPKEEFLEETLAAYIEHIKSYNPQDKEYSKRGLLVLSKYLYNEEAKKRIDFTKLGSLELAKKQSYENYKVNPEAVLCYYQPPGISYKLKGKMAIIDENDSGKREIYRQFINAQHDVYHTPNPDSWLKKPAYIFTIEEIFNNGVSKDGFGTKLQFPY